MKIKILFTIIFCLIIISPTSSYGQDDEDEITIYNQTPLIHPGETWKLEVNIEKINKQSQNLSLDVTIYSPEKNQNNPVPIHRLPTQTINPNTKVHTIEIPIRGNNSTTTKDSILIPDFGLYPVSLDFKTNNSIIKTLNTYLIVADSSNPKQLILLTKLESENLDNQIEILKNSKPDLTTLITFDVLKQLRTNIKTRTNLINSLKNRKVALLMNQDIELIQLPSEIRKSAYFDQLSIFKEELNQYGFNVDENTAILNSQISKELSEDFINNGYKRIIRFSQPESTFSILNSSDKKLIIIDSTTELENNLDQQLQLLKTTYDSESNLSLGIVNLNKVNSNKAIQDLNNYNNDIKVIDLSLTEKINELAQFQTVQQKNIKPPEQILNLSKDINDYYKFQTPDIDTDIEIYKNYDKAMSSDPYDLDLISKTKEQLESEFSSISLTKNQSVNLTSTNATIPITIINKSKGSKRVELILQSDKIDIKPKKQIIIVEPGTNLENVDVNLRSLGTSFLDIKLTTVQGKVLDSSRMKLRSTAFGIAGLTVTIFALFGLIVWWLLSALKNNQHEKTNAKISNK